MGSSKNKFIATLAISNILGFIVIFTLLWMLWSNNNANISNNMNDTVTYAPPASPSTVQKRYITEPVKTSRPSVNAEDISIITAVAKEVKSNYPDSSGSSGRPENKNTEAPKVAGKVTTKNTLSDNEYVASYNQLKSSPAVSKKEVSKSDATSVQITNKSTDKNKASTDHFNKVDVSHLKSNPSNKMTLAQQVAAFAKIATIEPSSGGKKADDSEAWQDYLDSLKEAEAERQNEMRTITVVQGETLWKISTRAYGTGFLYKKIFEANPHLTSPDSITVGETLRVPL